jgi:hypothetical protein
MNSGALYRTSRYTTLSPYGRIGHTDGMLRTIYFMRIYVAWWKNTKM